MFRKLEPGFLSVLVVHLWLISARAQVGRPDLEFATHTVDYGMRSTVSVTVELARAGALERPSTWRKVSVVTRCS